MSRWTDQEIVDYLHDEKRIDLARSTVSKIKNQIEAQAEKWYIELRESRYKYIATYKERLDSLFSYQKKLHEIISATKKPEVQIRAISELHSIEMSIFNLWKQLPDLRIEDSRDNRDHNRNEYQYPSINGLPRAILRTGKEDEEHDRAVYFGWKEGDPPLDGRFRTRMEEKYGVDNEPWGEFRWIQCSSCKRWFKTEEMLDVHKCSPEPIV